MQRLHAFHRIRRRTDRRTTSSGIFDRGRTLRLEPLESRHLLSGVGLTGQYFHNADFTGLADTRQEAVSFNWGNAGPGAGVDGDSFSVRWTGQLEPEFTETYTLAVGSDEGVRLWIDGELVIDDWSPHTMRIRSVNVPLVAGQRYDVRLDYYEGSGTARVELWWSSPSQSFETIPVERLHPSPSGLLARYWDTLSGEAHGIDTTIDFDWGSSPPVSGLAADQFHAEWTGQIRGDFSDEYVFSTISDDGVRLWIGGELLIDNWTAHAPTEDVGSKRLEAGKWYDIRLEYFEESGGATIQLRWSSLRQTGEGVSEVVPQSNLRAAAEPSPGNFQNPLGPGADPFVIRWQDHYLLVRSAGNSVWIDRASSLHEIHQSHPNSQSTRAWTAPGGTHYSRQIWAPELHQLDGKWYIYVAASDGNNATHRMHVLERDSPDPFGPYVYKGQITPVTDRWAIDGTVLEWQGQRYFIWSGWPGFVDGQQNLYIARMQNPWTLASDRALISTPEFGWERHGLAINEGPQVLIHDGQLHIIYSASGFWTPQYALGRLTYSGTGLLLHQASWIKSPNPVFQATSLVVGTGHASFTKSPDGHQDWIVYHAHSDPDNWNDVRDVRMQPFGWNPDGTPNFGEPIPPGQPIEVPAGGADPERPFVAGDYNADGLVTSLDEQTWRVTYGMSVFPGSAADGNGNGRVDAADYVLWRNRQAQVAATSNASSPAPDRTTVAVVPPTGLPSPTGPNADFANRRASQQQLTTSADQPSSHMLLLALERANDRRQRNKADQRQPVTESTRGLGPAHGGDIHANAAGSVVAAPKNTGADDTEA